MPLASSDPRLTFPPMKRSGETLESGATKERKRTEGAPQNAGKATAPKDRKHGGNLEAYGISASSGDNIRLAPAPEDIQNAIDFPTAGWPSYQALWVRPPSSPIVGSIADCRTCRSGPQDNPEPCGRQGYRLQGLGSSGGWPGGFGGMAYDERGRRHVFPIDGARKRSVPPSRPPCTRTS